MPDKKSSITIRDGVGLINWEFATDLVISEDLTVGTRTYHTRQMQIDCGGGYALSVVFGFGTYSDNYMREFHGLPFAEEVERAEIAATHHECGILDIFQDEWGGDSVRGHQDAGEVMYWVQRTRDFAKEHKEDTQGIVAETLRQRDELWARVREETAFIEAQELVRDSTEQDR